MNARPTLPARATAITANRSAASAAPTASPSRNMSIRGPSLRNS